MNPPRSLPLFLVILMPALILPSQAWSFPRSRDTPSLLSSIYKCLDNYEHQQSQNSLGKQPWLRKTGDGTSKRPSTKYCEEILDQLFSNTNTPLDFVSIAGIGDKYSEATKRSTKFPNVEENKASTFDRLKYLEDNDDDNVANDDISAVKMFHKEDQNSDRPVELSKLKTFLFRHKEASDNSLEKSSKSRLPKTSDFTGTGDEERGIDAFDDFKSLYKDVSKNVIAPLENTNDKENGFGGYRLADIPIVSHMVHRRRSQLELKFPDDPIQENRHREPKTSSTPENREIKSSKRAYISWPLIDMMQFAVAKRRRQTMSINNALMALTNMMLAKGRERLMKNRESLRHHMFVQG